MNKLPNIFRLVRHIKTEEGYKKVSEWQLAEDVECADGNTLHTPTAGAWLVFCYGANDMYRAQIAIPLGGGALASRARQASGWGKWYNASLTVM